MSDTKHHAKCSQRIATHTESHLLLVWGNAASPFPHTQTGEGNKLPQESASTQYTRGTPATPPQRRRELRARARPGRGHPLTSVHHDVYHPHRCPLSTPEHTFSHTEKPQHSRSTEPVGANLCHFVGIPWLTTATGLVQESSTSSFVPAPAAREERDEEGS